MTLTLEDFLKRPQFVALFGLLVSVTALVNPSIGLYQWGTGLFSKYFFWAVFFVCWLALAVTAHEYAVRVRTITTDTLMNYKDAVDRWDTQAMAAYASTLRRAIRLTPELREQLWLGNRVRNMGLLEQELSLNRKVLRRQTRHRLVAYILNGAVIFLWIMVVLLSLELASLGPFAWLLLLTLVLPTILWWQWSGWSLTLARGYLDALAAWLIILSVTDLIEWKLRSAVLPLVWFPEFMLALSFAGPLICWLVSFITLHGKGFGEDAGGWLEVWVVRLFRRIAKPLSRYRQSSPSTKG